MVSKLILVIATGLTLISSASDYLTSYGSLLPGVPVVVEPGETCFGVEEVPLLYTVKFYSSVGYLGEEQQLSPLLETISRDVSLTKDLTYVEARVFDLLGAVVQTFRWSLIFPLTPPDSFDLLQPTDGEGFDYPNTPLVLEWEEAEDASEYEVYLEMGDSTPDVKVATVTSNRWHHGEGIARGTWYWKVVAVNGDGSTSSTTKSFLLKDEPPGAFGNRSPADMSSRPTAFNSISLSWEASARAKTYEVYLERENSNPTARFGSVSADRTSFGAQRSLEEGVWYWRVVAKNTGGSYEGPVSRIRVFGKPKPFGNSYPTGLLSFELYSGPPRLHWANSSDATSYRVYLEKGESDPGQLVGTTEETEWTIETDLDEGIWYWRVEATNVNGSTWSDPSAFRIVRPDVGEMNIVFPDDGDVTALPLQPSFLDWSDSLFATSYEVYLEKGSEEPTTLVGTVDSSTWTIDFGLSEGDWRWRIKAINSEGQTRWSPTSSFRIAPAVPGAAPLIQPARNALFTLPEQPALFDWNDASDATSYRVYLGQSLPLPQVATVTVSEWAPNTALVEGDWMWNVVAVNETGESVSETRTLRIRSELTGYDLWLSENPGIPVGQRGRNDDPDGDGVVNMLERFFASSPIDPQESGNVHWVKSGGGPRMRFHRKKNYESSDGVARWSLDMSNWYLGGESDGNRSVALPIMVVDTSDPGFDLVELAPHSSEPLSRLFLRIENE